MAVILYALLLTLLPGSAKSVPADYTPLKEAFVHDSSSTSPKSCSYSTSGTWANSTVIYVSPYPPKADQPLNVYLKFTAVDDLWFGNVHGNVTRLEDQWVYSFDFAVCGSEGICPIRKGETRVYNETLPSPSTFGPKGTYSAWADVFNQDDETIYSITVENCPLK